MADASKSIGVIGAGITGLETALHLAKRDFNVTVFAAKIEKTLSATVPPAFIAPYPPALQAALGGQRDDVERWMKMTLKHDRALMDQPASGISRCNGILVFDSQPTDLPSWSEMYNAREITAADVPPEQKFSEGWHIETIHIDPTQYLENLRLEIRHRGGQITCERFDSIEAAVSAYNNIDGWVACPGIGAKTLIPDKAVFAVRGQLVEVVLDAQHAQHFPGFVLSDPAHVKPDHDGDFEYAVKVKTLPGGDTHFVVGGTADLVDNTDPMSEGDACERARADILQRCEEQFPLLRHATFFRDRVGRRPCRQGGVRIGRAEQDIESKPVWYNYGHSGDGYTFRIGCAEDVATDVQQVFENT